MAEKLKFYWTELKKKEKLTVLVPILGAIILTLWIASPSNSKKPDGESEPSEIGVIIPKGFLMVPLELANAASLDSLIQKQAIVDIFSAGRAQVLVENLRILKLNAGAGPLFGALVPESLAGIAQDQFARPHLRGAIRTMDAKATRFHFRESQKPLLIEIPTGGDS